MTDQRVCSGTTSVGDQFSTHLTEDIVGPLGIVIPKGSIATGQVISASNPGETPVVRIESLTVRGRTYKLGSEVTYTQLDKVRTGSRAAPAKVIAGAGIGAILGRVIGGNAKSTVIGAATGAAAGAVVSNRTARFDRCIPNDGRINARLTEPLRVALSE